MIKWTSGKMLGKPGDERGKELRRSGLQKAKKLRMRRRAKKKKKKILNLKLKREVERKVKEKVRGGEDER